MADRGKHAIESLAAATEDWCAKAFDMGEGYRLFRSEPRWENDVKGHRLIVDFQILAEDEPPPSSGTVYGPWPEDLAPRVARLSRNDDFRKSQ